MMVASPTAAHGLSQGAVLVAMGRTIPRAPAISATPMKVTSPREMLVGPFFSDWVLYFSYAKSFIAPAAMNASARSPWTIHMAKFMQSSFFFFNEKVDGVVQRERGRFVRARRLTTRQPLREPGSQRE